MTIDELKAAGFYTEAEKEDDGTVVAWWAYGPCSCGHGNDLIVCGAESEEAAWEACRRYYERDT